MPCCIYGLIMRHKLRVYSHRGGDRGGGEGNSHNIPECDKAEYEVHDCAYFDLENFGVCFTISDDDNDAMILVKVMKLQAGFN